jgi:cupin 2 domain-containing protein
MQTLSGNLLANVPQRLDDEQFSELLAAPGLKIERIVSTGQNTPPGEWLVQDRDEWVLLVQGEAAVRLEGSAEAAVLRPGAYLPIPAGIRHRVEYTTSDPPTVWLAVHYG